MKNNRSLRRLRSSIYSGIFVCAFILTACGSSTVEASSDSIIAESVVLSSGSQAVEVSSSSASSSSSSSAGSESSSTEAPPSSSVAPLAEEEKPTGTPDFEELQAINPHIYAWIRVTGTNIDYPILQAPNDDEYYLRRDIHLKKDIKGSLFTQVTYNAKDFEDNHTVVYGHNMFKIEGGMFSHLVKFQDKEFFDKNRDITIFMPDQELHYKIFAAYQWSDEHLIYNYATWDKTLYGNYLEMVFNNRDLTANIDHDIKVTSDNKIITLTTCVTLNGPKRLLIQAVRV